VQSSSQIIATNKPTPSFLQAGCPSCRPTDSVKSLKGNYLINSFSHYLLWLEELIIIKICSPKNTNLFFQLSSFNDVSILNVDSGIVICKTLAKCLK